MRTSDQPAHYVLEADEPMDLWEWFCYVKPIGPSLRISIRQGSQGGLSASTSGTEPRLSEAISPIRDVRPGAAEV
jgi:hypothetical protein